MNPNLEMIELVADRLGDLCHDVVFLGGAVTSLLLTDSGAAAVRFTADVDIIIDVASKAAYDRLSEKLRSRGFREDMSDDAPICRWIVGGVKVDVMPMAAKVLGFGNRWFASASRYAERRSVGKGIVRVVTAPYFLATKLEAFDGRGSGDYRSSHDLEDFIAVIDGRKEIADEIRRSPKDLSSYISRRVGLLLDSSLFMEALPGHLEGDMTSQARLPLIVQRLKDIAGR